MATTVLLRLAALTGEGRYRTAAEAALGVARPLPRPPPDGVRPVAVRPRARARRSRPRSRSSASPADAATRAARRRRRPRLPPVPRPGVVAGARRLGRAAAPRPVRPQRAADRVRVPRLRLPPARQRARGARGPPCRRLTRAPPVVEPRPAATVVLMRPGPRGPEVLLTRRPSTMAFGPGLHVFPGGAIDPADASTGGDPFAAAAIRELAEEVGIVVAPDALVPLSRWVTPPGSSRRYDTRFFVAAMPDGATVVPDPREVAAHRLADAGRGPGRDGRGRRSTCGRRRARRSSSWRPLATSTTSGATSRPVAPLERTRRRAPVARARPDHVRRRRRDRRADGGRLPRGPVAAGRRRPGRPVRRGGRGGRVPWRPPAARGSPRSCSRAPVPDHAAGAETLALRLDVPILASPGARAVLSSDIVPIEDARRPGLRRRRDPGPRDARDAPRPPGVRAARDGRGPGRRPVRSRAVDGRSRSRSTRRRSADHAALVEGLAGSRLAAHR